MLNLELELLGILILVAVIGLLMGRFLCKNGEYTERAEKEKSINEYKTLHSELESILTRENKQLYIIKELNDKLIEQEDKIDSFNSKQFSLNTQREELLRELHAMEIYKPKFKSLKKEYDIKLKEIDKLKEDNIINKKIISNFEISTNELDRKLEYIKEKNLKFKDNINRYQAQLQSKTKELELSKKEIKSVESDYAEFKINYNLNNNKIKMLESDNKKLYHTLENIVFERDNLLSRLRAISSVIGVVGIDNGENS